MQTLLGVSLLFGAGIAAQADPITFNVDMSAFTNSAGAPIYTNVTIGGDFTGWSTTDYPLTNAGSGIWSGVIEVPGSPGDTSHNFKYIWNPGGNWEDGGNHVITLTGSPQTLPLNPFYAPNAIHPTDPPVYTTNNITFQVDMRVQGVAWINGGGIIRVSGGFQGWNDGFDLTNDPTAQFPTNWFYKGTFLAVTELIPSYAPPGAKINRYKFRANGGWEEPSTINANGNNDRWWDATTAGDRVLPLVLYSDASLCDTLSEETAVTFVLHITNGTTALDGIVFDNTSGKIHINGESVLGTWQPWNFTLPTLDREGTSDYYTNTFILPAGRPRNQKVKYSITDAGDNGGDNENVSFADHIQWIRGTNSTYRMDPVEFGTNFTSSLVQPQFGNLKAGAPSGGTVPITWLGCGCVTLQSKTDLVSGSWTDMPETDGTSSTNVANTGTKFFRLQKRPNP